MKLALERLPLRSYEPFIVLTLADISALQLVRIDLAAHRERHMLIIRNIERNVGHAVCVLVNRRFPDVTVSESNHGNFGYDGLESDYKLTTPVRFHHCECSVLGEPNLW